jgi:hypothetical protein
VDVLVSSWSREYWLKSWYNPYAKVDRNFVSCCRNLFPGSEHYVLHLLLAFFLAEFACCRFGAGDYGWSCFANFLPPANGWVGVDFVSRWNYSGVPERRRVLEADQPVELHGGLWRDRRWLQTLLHPPLPILIPTP